ncbi:S9 family peptidase [Prevotella sp. 10(H)]|uniref:alpha/beta hydrolase family protein n=1 Tax=Prevotella sp. 10(H) TaxID=1158294 RepID=UPI0004A6FB67|nr:alpha/beta hydrolase [Prevotella sp. 10(H)]
MKKLLSLTLFLVFSWSLSAQFLNIEEPIVLKTATGDIHGTLKVYPADNKAIPVAILIAGSGPTDRNGNQPSTKNNSLKMLSDALCSNGIAALTFDKRAIGESASAAKSEADLRFEDYINDVKGWVELLSKDKRFSDIIIIGHSEGSLIGMVAAKNNTKVSKYVSIAGVGVPAGDILKEQLGKQLALQPQATKDMIFSYIDKLEKGETIAHIPPSMNTLFRPSVQPYMISWFKYNPQKEISQLTIPILIIQGTTDIQVSVKEADLLATANKKAKKIIVENMDHVMKNSTTTDQQTQLKDSYMNPDKPVMKEVIDNIVSFIKE